MRIMPRYSFLSSDGKNDPRYEDLELDDTPAASRMASKFARDVMATDPAYVPDGDFYSVRVIEDGVVLFTVLTFRAAATSGCQAG
jgi:hypothetical protein